MAIKKLTQPSYVLSDGITQSMLATFLRCRQLAKFNLDRWEPKEAPSVFDFGDLFHYCLEHYYRSSTILDPKEFFAVASNNWMKSKTGPISHDIDKTLEEAEALWVPYVNHWAKRDQKITWQALEKVFDVQWRGFRLRGKIDGLFTRDSKWWNLETKTKSQIDEDSITDCLTFDLQNLFYITALSVENIKPIGVLYNVIRRPSLRRGKTETLEDFQQRIIEDIRDKRPDHYFKRFEVVYTAQNIQRFQDELYAKLCEFRDWRNGILKTYRNETACIGRGRCSFLSACSSGTMVGYAQTKTLFRELL